MGIEALNNYIRHLRIDKYCNISLKNLAQFKRVKYEISSIFRYTRRQKEYIPAIIIIKGSKSTLITP